MKIRSNDANRKRVLFSTSGNVSVWSTEQFSFIFFFWFLKFYLILWIFFVTELSFGEQENVRKMLACWCEQILNNEWIAEAMKRAIQATMMPMAMRLKRAKSRKNLIKLRCRRSTNKRRHKWNERIDVKSKRLKLKRKCAGTLTLSFRWFHIQTKDTKPTNEWKMQRDKGKTQWNRLKREIIYFYYWWIERDEMEAVFPCLSLSLSLVSFWSSSRRLSSSKSFHFFHLRRIVCAWRKLDAAKSIHSRPFQFVNFAFALTIKLTERDRTNEREK